MSVVLHEYDINAVIGMKAKKLCCHLIWDKKDREMPIANGGSVSQSAAVAGVSVMVASLLAAVLL